MDTVIKNLPADFVPKRAPNGEMGDLSNAREWLRTQLSRRTLPVEGVLEDVRLTLRGDEVDATIYVKLPHDVKAGTMRRRCSFYAHTTIPTDQRTEYRDMKKGIRPAMTITDSSFTLEPVDSRQVKNEAADLKLILSGKLEALEPAARS